MNEAETLARSRLGSMIAAAGCGKTYLIGMAVAKYGNGRELVLTHTHAGVDALRRRLATFGVPAKAYHVDTIAGWALRLAVSFPRTSALPTPKPRSIDEYDAVYVAATRLLHLRPIQDILRASYTGVYVDEYQDCTIEQHELVLALADILPCRIVGDPLQVIFDFGNNKPIDWNTHVVPHFEPVPEPTVPWRWRNSNPELGEWLQEVRERLSNGCDLDLRSAPVQWIEARSMETSQGKQQLAACFDAARSDGKRVIAILQWRNQCHELASRLRGIYSCVEAIDEKDLYEAAKQFDNAIGPARAIAVLDFAKKCMTKVSTELRSTRNAFSEGRPPKGRKHREQIEALIAVAQEPDYRPVAVALESFRLIPGAKVYRRELLREMMKSILAVATAEAANLEEAAWIVRNRTRQIGRRLPRCAVGTTLLVKGLEFDHAVLLDADAYNRRNLYVALTRGSTSLTIVSRSQIIQPKEDG